MRKSTLGLLSSLIFVFGQGAAQAAADQLCLARDERESAGAYTDRVHAACEAAWSKLTPAGTAGQHGGYLKRCEKPCIDKVASAGVPTTALLLGGLAVAGGAGAAAAGSKGGGAPASP